MNLGIGLGVGIPVFVGVILAVVFTLVASRRKQAVAALRAEMEQSGERIMDGPGWAQKRDGHVSISGNLIVTDKRLVFVSGGGSRVSVPFTDIMSVRHDTSFNGSYFSGAKWLILTLRGAPKEVGFVTRLTSLETTVRAPVAG